MWEAILLALAKPIIEKITSFIGNLAKEELQRGESNKKNLQLIRDQMIAICAVVKDAEEKQYTNEAFQIWLKDLKYLAYDIDDLLDEVAFDALVRKIEDGDLHDWLRYHLSFSIPIFFRAELSDKITELRKNLKAIVDKKDKFDLTARPVEGSRNEIRNPLDQCPYLNPKTVFFGRDKDVKDIINRVLAASNSSSGDEVCVLPIVGMGGIGKTALAKLVFRDVPDFDLKLWACVSDGFGLSRIMKKLLEDAEIQIPNRSFGTLLQTLQRKLKGKKYLLVLDDVWPHVSQPWNDFRDIFTNGIAGNTILITTRDANVSSITRTLEPYYVNRLSDKDCWFIFSQMVFEEGDKAKYQDLHPIGESIVKKCFGVPLVVKCLANLLTNERDKQKWLRIKKMSSFTELNEQFDQVLKCVRVSYEKLPSVLKPFFPYLSLWDTDMSINLDIEYVWSAIGLLGLRAKGNKFDSCAYSYLKILKSRSLIQEPTLDIEGIVFRSKRHNLLRDLGRKIMGEDLAIINSKELKVSKFTRFIVWGSESDLSIFDKEFPKQLLEAKRARMFRFGYKIERRISQDFLEKCISSLIYLRYFDLGSSSFEKLPSSIGNLKHLRYLDLSHNVMLQSLPRTICKLLNLETLRLEGCEQLQKLPTGVHHLQGLMYFRITTKQQSLSPEFNKFSSLRNLVFQSCKNLVSLWDNDNVGSLTSLTSLRIINCSELTCLPRSMKYLVGLERLEICECEKLNLMQGEGLKGLESLRLLEISGVPQLTSMPVGIKAAKASLCYLKITRCKGLIKLPTWLQHFSRLQCIVIRDCNELLSLPQGFDHLSSLQELRIQNCRYLSERCAAPTGKDYTLIQHVAKFYLDGVYIAPNQKQRIRN